MSSEQMISKDPIIGFLVIKHISAKGRTNIWTMPLSINWEGSENHEEINGILNEDNITGGRTEVIGILPAPADSYEVYGYSIKGSDKKLGYEFKGAYHPDWKEELGNPVYKYSVLVNIKTVISNLRKKVY
jgi:hypothetical protein